MNVLKEEYHTLPMSFFVVWCYQLIFFQILLDIKQYFIKQPSLVEIPIGDDNKFTVCGDIHGQFYDLMNIFDLNGLPSETNPYLFNGDFVDRGSFSVECIFTLFGFKLLYPNYFFMSRGKALKFYLLSMFLRSFEIKLVINPQNLHV